MPTNELDDLTSDDVATGDVADVATDLEGDDEPSPLGLEVAIKEPSACERHITVTISRDDIERYFDDAFSEMMPEAQVPGFRIGRAPCKLVEHRFRKEVSDQIKGKLLVDSLEQISDEYEFTAISEPDFDLDAVEVPDEGPMTFEFDIEVRPEFDLPNWKGLNIKRPVCDYTDEDIDYQLEQMLERYSQLVPSADPASVGDYLTLNITCTCDGKQTATATEETVRLQPTLSFRDTTLDDFDTLMAGVQSGDRRTAEVVLTQGAQNEEFRGQTVGVAFEVLEVKKLRLPELTDDFLEEMGGFDGEGDLRDAIREDLDRRLEYEQRQDTRQQITARLTESADWELPPAMLKRQSARELERAVMELRRSGFSEADIRERENKLRQNSQAATASALKEHFILERIAEEEEIDAEESDFEAEIQLIATQSDEPARRVRAQLEKRGLMDVLRNQIIERKVLSHVESEANFQGTPVQMSRQTVEAIDFAAGGGGVATEVQETASEEEKE